MLFAKKTEITQFAVDDIRNLSGFIVFHSTEKSPASVPTQKLWAVGEEILHESILGVDIQYSWDSFFQNNVPVFEEALNMMKNALPAHANVLELYSGVGTIGLSLAKNAEHVHGVEIIQGAVDSAKENAARAKLSNYVAECIPAEKMDARLFDKKNVLVLDPPRVGLHPKIIEEIRTKLPQAIIYLSCNPETQARDYSLLAEHYHIDLIHGFDFYPQTPHVESLLVLTLRPS
jgi:23S rRNA (uracil1939-C5)-methyltransferase